MTVIDEDQPGRVDIRAERDGQVVHLTKFKFDGPGRRRRPIDQLRDDGVITPAGHAGAERYLDLLEIRAPRLSGSQEEFNPSQPGSRCLTNDVRRAAFDAIEAARSSVTDAVGRMGWQILDQMIHGATLADLALQRGYVRGMGRGNAARMHSQAKDAFDALGKHFADSDKRVKVR